MPRWLLNLSLLTVSIVAALVVVEITSRIIMPISPGVRYLDGRGNAVVLRSSNPYRLVSGQYHEVAYEFDAVVTVGEGGNRVPNSRGNPHTIFLGDSFTFGQGLSDRETFVSIYCQDLNLECENMGRSGTGTLEQADILAHYLRTEGWQPKSVKVFLLAMKSALMSGNDLVDNIEYAEGRRDPLKTPVGVEPDSPQPEIRPKPVGWNASAIIGMLRSGLLANSNLIRIAYFYFGPIMRSAVSPQPDQDRLEKGLELTKLALAEIFDLGQKFGFDTEIFVLHPIQDIINGSAADTFAEIQSRVSFATVIETYHLFEASPGEFYYAFDGHLNPRGSRKIADFLLAKRTSGKPE